MPAKVCRIILNNIITQLRVCEEKVQKRNLKILKQVHAGTTENIANSEDILAGKSVHYPMSICSKIKHQAAKKETES